MGRGLGVGRSALALGVLALRNGLQSVSRDLLRLHEQFDAARALSLWSSGPGHFVSTALLVWSAYLLVLSQLVLAMLRLEFYFESPGSMLDLQYAQTDKPNIGTLGSWRSTFDVATLASRLEKCKGRAACGCLG